MSEEERKRYEKAQRLEAVKKEIEAKERAAVQAEAERKLKMLQQVQDDPLDQFMAQLQGQTTSGANSATTTEHTTAEAGDNTSSKRQAPIKTISFEEIVKQIQPATASSSSDIAASDDPSESQDSDTDVVTGGSFLDAMDVDSEVAERNVTLENQADAEVSDSDVDEATFYEEFRKEMARRREAERLIAEENRREEEKARELEEKERKKQQKLQESLGVIYGDADAESEATYRQRQGKSALELLREKMKKKELKQVDHSKVEYLTIRKDFYREHPAVSRQDPNVVKQQLKKLEIKVRGRRAPKPIMEWDYAGLDPRVLRMLQKLGFQTPFAIQSMAIPALMSGRDIIGVAKTGSGKTLAFLLPLFRHVLDQPPLQEGEGPIGLVMAPARELAVQIYRETKRFAKSLNMRTVAVYGGSPVSEQINALKSGAEIVVATPGRFIDLLTLNAGKLISLSRVSYLVLDEADRMFDMGFEPQIAMVTRNIRPDRQTALFSATFPSHVERLARKLLKHKPLEIIVGGRSKVASEIEQFVEVRNDTQKFLRLLQLLGLWQGKGSVLVFCDTQELCDRLYTRLFEAGYYCLSLHSGKDQADRDQTIADFKNRQRDIMIATSLAGRGLDVKSLTLVINYSCPNHLEDYVQRCGRTGRAGNKGTAYTFIDPVTEEQFVPDVVKALDESGVDIPSAVLDLQDQFEAKLKAGTARKAISGYKGKGHKFDANEAGEVAVEREIERVRREVGAGIRDAADLVEVEAEYKKLQAEKEASKEKGDQATTNSASGKSGKSGTSAANKAADDGQLRAQVAQMIAQKISSGSSSDLDVASVVRAAKLAKKHGASFVGGPRMALDGDKQVYEEELEINDYPFKARQNAMHRDALQATQEFTGTAVITKGKYIQPGRKPKEGERKLYLLIQGPTPISVKRAKEDLLRILEETTHTVGFDKAMIAGKYSVA